MALRCISHQFDGKTERCIYCGISIKSSKMDMKDWINTHSEKLEQVTNEEKLYRNLFFSIYFDVSTFKVNNTI